MVSGILKGDKTGAFQRWELPSMDFDAVQENEPAEYLVSQEELEAIHQQAHAKGYQMGRWEGMNAAKEELDSHAEQLTRIIQSFTHPFEQLDEDVQQELVLLATAMASQLACKEVTTDPSVINHIVSQAVSSLASVGRRVDVHLCPSDAALVRDVLKSPDPEQHWHIVEDASLQSCDVRVIANNTFVDASLRTRIKGMITELINIDPKTLNDTLDAALSVSSDGTTSEQQSESSVDGANSSCLIESEMV